MSQIHASHALSSVSSVKQHLLNQLQLDMCKTLNADSAVWNPSRPGASGARREVQPAVSSAAQLGDLRIKASERSAVQDCED